MGPGLVSPEVYLEIDWGTFTDMLQWGRTSSARIAGRGTGFWKHTSNLNGAGLGQPGS
jgi:hypothetical protein